MNVLVIYGTTEGQTRKVAEHAAALIRERGHVAELYDSADPITEVDFDSFQAIVVAASVHQEQHQSAIKGLVAAHLALLNDRPSAFISVSLSAVLEETRPEAQKYVDQFLSLTGWRPCMTLLLGGALRFDEYDYFQEQIVKFIVMKRGVDQAPGRDREFTDWTALDDFLDTFLKTAAGRSVTS